MTALDGRVWEVVGGVGKGGVLVRAGRELSSPQARGRLSTGALVLELALEGERLKFLRLSGSGPSSGWISTSVGDKPLVVEANSEAAASASAALLTKDGAERWRDILSSRERIALSGAAWHEVLGVSRDSTAEEVKRAYRELSLLHHPDKSPFGGDDDDDTFKRIVTAYEESQLRTEGSATRTERVALRARVKQWFNGEGESVDTEVLEPSEVADMLLEGSCVVVDTRDKHEQEFQGFMPGRLDGFDYSKLMLQPDLMDEQTRRLRSLADEGRRAVAISTSGSGRCAEICSMLVVLFHFDASEVCSVEGGFQQWQAWRSKNEAKYQRACEAARCL